MSGNHSTVVWRANLSAMTNPTCSRMPEAGRNGSNSRARAIPTAIRSLRDMGYDDSVCISVHTCYLSVVTLIVLQHHI